MPFMPALTPGRQRLRALVASVMWLAGVATAGQPNVGALEPCIDDAQMQKAVEQINALRRQAAPCASTHAAMQRLTWEAKLAVSAHEQATDLALQDRLSHTDSRNRGLGVRLRSVGYASAGAGENLAAGQSDIEDTLQAWLASPSHCANLMQPEYRDVGLACVQRRGSRYERFWVAHFGVPATGTAATARR
jgi:uncharacterized protein YkwD